MKKLIIIFFIASTFYAQNDNLFDYCNKLKTKIQIGSTFNEVKKAFGKPQAIIPGSPNEDKIILAVNEPEISGQLVYTSWIYGLKKVSLKDKIISDGMYWLNGKAVSKELYEDYRNETSIYVINGKIIAKASAKSYMLLRDKRLEAIDKNLLTSGRLINEKAQGKFFPVIYIVFEKSSQMVASIAVFLIPDMEI